MNLQPKILPSKPSRFTVCHFCASSRLMSFSQIQIQNSEIKNLMALTSSWAIAIFPNRQATHLPEPQRPSRVVKVRQASQKAAPSSLDVKPSPPCTAFHLRSSAKICDKKRPFEFCVSCASSRLTFPSFSSLPYVNVFGP